MTEPVKVVYLDSSQVMPIFDVRHNRVELPESIRAYPELHAFTLRHELDHAQIQQKYGLSWRHIWLDIKNRCQILSNKPLFDQFRAFEKWRRPMNTKEILFFALYDIIGSFTWLLSCLFVVGWVIKDKLRRHSDV